MRVLVVKTSSLGDIVHTFPALSDACDAIDGIRFDWVVEEAFQQLPGWHPAVDQTITSAVRRWRHSWLETMVGGEWKAFLKALQADDYDAVIDAQGLIKSGLITRKARGVKHGYDRQSAREPMACWFYDKTHFVSREQHAIQRTRQLFAHVLGYSIADTPLKYGLSVEPDSSISSDSILFLHGTTWASKRWPMAFWQALARLAAAEGMQVLIPSGNTEERQFADELAATSDAIVALDEHSLADMASLIKAMRGVVSVDSGLAHLASALQVPAVGLYGATNAELTGILGDKQRSLQAAIDCSPCLQRVCPRLEQGKVSAPCTDTLDADRAWQTLKAML